MALLNFLTGSQGQLKQAPNLTPGQQNLQSQLLNQIQGMLGQQKPADFAPIAQQARTQFQTKTIPGLAERFTSMGGGLSSSAFQGALGSAASGLEQGLASQQSQFNLQNQAQQNQLLQSLLGFALKPQFENYFEQGQSGVLNPLFENAGPLVKSALPLLLAYLTGGTAPAAGAATGGLSGLLSQFGGQ